MKILLTKFSPKACIGDWRKFPCIWYMVYRVAVFGTLSIVLWNLQRPSAKKVVLADPPHSSEMRFAPCATNQIYLELTCGRGGNSCLCACCHCGPTLCRTMDFTDVQWHLNLKFPTYRPDTLLMKQNIKLGMARPYNLQVSLYYYNIIVHEL